MTLEDLAPSATRVELDCVAVNIGELTGAQQTDTPSLAFPPLQGCMNLSRQPGQGPHTPLYNP